MEQKQILQQIVGYNKATFDTVFNTLAMLQDQVERATKMLVEQSTWLPNEGKKVVEEWVSAYKQGRDNFKGSVDESFQKVENYLSQNP